MEGTKVALTNTQAAADAGCRIDIRIESRGDVNIYNATDEALVRQKLSYAIVAAGLGS